MPGIQWWREDYQYRGGQLKQVENNETFKIFEMGKNSALQVKKLLTAEKLLLFYCRIIDNFFHGIPVIYKLMRKFMLFEL